MNKNFTVIVNEKLEQKKLDHTYKVARLNELWNRQYLNSILQANEKNKELKLRIIRKRI